MDHGLPLKKLLFQKCVEHIDQRIQLIEQTLSSVQESRNNETKSSVGDKYETGRAMMQIEEEKNRAQLVQALAVKNELMQIDISDQTTHVLPGSLVITNKGKYFIAIGIGKIEIENVLFYCVSRFSPIGTQLIGKISGEEIEFNGKHIRIDEVL
jgi:hypothetical protein